MARNKISRRALLRGMAGGAAVAVGLPLFDLFCNDHGDALAQGGSFPKRFGIFFWGNGNIPQFWTPTGEGFGTDWGLSSQLAPLAGVKQHLCVVSGMAVKTANTEAHSAGASGIFSGGSLYNNGQGNTFPAASIDQIIASKIKGPTRFPSIQTSCDGGDTHSYTGPYAKNPGETSPLALYNRIFGMGFTAPGETPIVDPSIPLRVSVLDAVADDATRLRQRLGTRDRQRLDQHLQSIRDIESALTAPPPTFAACLRPSMPAADASFAPIEGREQLVALNAAFTELIALALACDQTRVFGHWFTHSVTSALFQNVPDGHHRLTHDEQGDQPNVHEIVKQVVTQLAVLVNRLAQVEEGAGTLLDNSVVLATSDCSLGRQHRLDEYPLILAGTAGGRLKTDFHYRSPSLENASKVQFSIMQALGVAGVPAFGLDDGQVSSGLSGIEV